MLLSGQGHLPDDHRRSKWTDKLTREKDYDDGREVAAGAMHRWASPIAPTRSAEKKYSRLYRSDPDIADELVLDNYWHQHSPANIRHQRVPLLVLYHHLQEHTLVQSICLVNWIAPVASTIYQCFTLWKHLIYFLECVQCIPNQHVFTLHISLTVSRERSRAAVVVLSASVCHWLC